MKVVLAIPTYNGAHLLEKLLPEVVGQGFYKIYVLDDVSTDNTAEVCKKFPNVTHIRGDKNLGPTGNRNRVLGHDLGDILFFVDDDMRKLSNDIPKALSKIFEEHKEAGVVSAIIFNSSEELTRFQFHREMLGIKGHRDGLENKRFVSPETFNKPYVNVAWVLENAFAVRSKLFERLGGLDGKFRRFHEGPDLCVRARQAGFKVAITNTVTAVHSKPFSMFFGAHFRKLVRSTIYWTWKHRIKRIKAPRLIDDL